MEARVEMLQRRFQQEQQAMHEDDREEAGRFRRDVQERVAEEQREFERKLAVVRKERDDCLENRKKDAKSRQVLESETKEAQAREERAEQRRQEAQGSAAASSRDAGNQKRRCAEAEGTVAGLRDALEHAEAELEQEKNRVLGMQGQFRQELKLRKQRANREKEELADEAKAYYGGELSGLREELAAAKHRSE